jgi:hypothetical protein
MDLLTTDMPLILFKQKTDFMLGNANQILEFTTTENVAEFYCCCSGRKYTKISKNCW